MERKTLWMNENKMEENSIVIEMKNTFDALISRLGKWAWEYDRRLPKLKLKRKKTNHRWNRILKVYGKIIKEVTNIWSNNGWEFSRTNDRNQNRNPVNSENTKQGKY